MPSWPVSLPASPLAEGFSETPPATSLRTEMDQGPAKMRQRTTAGVGRLGFSLLLSLAQVQILDEFFRNDTKGGSLSFSFAHPRGGAAITCRFIEPPRYQAATGAWFRAQLSLEVLP